MTKLFDTLARLCAGMLLTLIVGGMLWLMVKHPQKSFNAQDETAARADTLATITAILQGDKKDLRLIDCWPDAPIVMLEASRTHAIDPYLLPCISRVEGPTKTMIDSFNIYGMEYSGKLVNMKSFSNATDCAAANILKKYKYRYQVQGEVNIDSLAAIWCPLNKKLWANNMKAIYERALK